MTRKIPPGVFVDTDTGRISIPTAEEVKEAVFIICMPLTSPLVEPDNHVGPCAFCGAAVQFRPDHPAGPMKVCMKCAVEAVGHQQ